ncbi:MAG: tryptophan--tRNA ligase, partial [Rhodospirillales bacterium]|nr:tryptophan--tRNA ligase [Rhodospirillales bacterium]
RDGTSKMSKSEPSENSRITMVDSTDDIVKKIRKAKTDPDALPETKEGFAGRPEAANLMSIYAALSDTTTDDVLAKFGGQQFSTFKQELADLAVATLSPIQDEMRRLMQDLDYVDSVLREGGARARAVSEPILAEVYDIVGFLR